MRTQGRVAKEESRRRVVTSGARAWTVHIGWVVTLIIALTGFIYARGSTDGNTHQALDAIDKRITERIETNSRENSQLHEELKQLHEESRTINGRVDTIMQVVFQIQQNQNQSTGKR